MVQKVNIITGQKFQNLCNHHLSIKEFMPFELYPSYKHIDVRDFDFTDFNNEEYIHINNDLTNDLIPKLKDINMFEILSEFKNPFTLILHNNDSPFGDDELKYFDIPNCKKIYSQNVITYDNRVIPLPIGLSNSCWEWGNLDIWDKVLQEDIDKDNFIYFNFEIDGGCRDEKRPDCYESISKQNIPWQSNKDMYTYVRNLKSYKFNISPQGNGVDCHRTWEALYLKTVPIVDRNITTEHFSKLFPMVLVDDWKEFNIESVRDTYNDYSWDNYDLLDFNNYCKKVGL